MSLRSDILACLSIAGLCASACAEYDPPPEATMVLPEGGAFQQGDQIEVEFSEPVAPDTLAFRVWPNERNLENEIPEDVEPLIDRCSVGTCGDLTVNLSGDRESATLVFDGELGTPGRPLTIELLEGLADADGNDTGTFSRWDIQFRATGLVNSEPVEFDQGVYIILAQVEKPIPTVLTLISDVRVLEDGRMALAGGEGDEINGDAKNTQNPRNLVIDETSQGWAAHVTGFVSLTEDGKRLMETEPVELNLPVGPLRVEMGSVRVFADVVENPETGKDMLDGTLSFESLTLWNGDRSNVQDGGSTAMVAQFVPPELVPEGTPEVCGNLCGAVVDGYCEVPEDFPPPGFCDE